MKIKEITWKKYESLINALSELISKEKVDYVICLGRGGFFVGDIISRKIDKPLGVLLISSYKGLKRQEQIKHSLLAYIGDVKGNILVVDDLTDSGKSMEFATEYLKKNFNILKTITATVFVKEDCIKYPDYFAVKSKKKIWLKMPVEKYDKEKI